MRCTPVLLQFATICEMNNKPCMTQGLLREGPGVSRRITYFEDFFTVFVM